MRKLKNYLRFLAAIQLLPALESGEETLVGGQAVLEGVMMRSPHAWAIACRKPSGEVVTMSEPLDRPSEKHKWMAWPIVRGVMTLGYAMNLGYRALRFSANVALEDMMQEDSAGTTHSTTAVSAVLPAQSAADSFQVQTSSSSSTSESQRQSREKAATLSNWLAAVNILISLAFFIFMYKYIPLLAATELKKVNPALGGRIVFNLIDGGIRLLLFLLFIWGVSLWKDIRRVYQYHGAEHKTVFAFENGDPLNTAAVQKYSTYHPRCGASFLMTVMLISIGFYLLGALRLAHRSAAGNRGSFLRDHSLRGQASRIAVRIDDCSRPLAAAHHYPATVGRSSPMRNRRARPRHVPRKRAWRGIGDCLGVPTPKTSSRFPVLSSQCKTHKMNFVQFGRDSA